MPSNALSVTLAQMLRDAEALDDTHARVGFIVPPPQDELDAIIRSVVIACVSAWEAFVEAVVIEAIETMRPPAPPLGSWSSHKAWVLGEIKRFNTPNAENVRLLLSHTLGLPDVSQAWSWPGQTQAMAIQDLTVVMKLRNQIAHGVNPRPVVLQQYSSQLPAFFRRLGEVTDQAIRTHLVRALGVPTPWPPSIRKPKSPM